MILSIIAGAPRHQDLGALSTIGGVSIVDLPATPNERAIDFRVICGDGATLAILYHDLQSLLSAIRVNVLLPTLIELKRASPWAYLLIGGIAFPNADGKVKLAGESATGWNWDALQGVLLTAQEMGIGVIQMQSYQSTASTIERLAKRNRAPVRCAPLRDGLFYDPADLILMALPGVGEAKAEAFLKHCGSAAMALMALTSEYAGAPGVGPETKKKAREALGLESGFALIPTKEHDLTLHEKAEIAMVTTRREAA